mmetsp:Transcript_77085/g.240231  ORF Transcript_77085/g.240231 Transcript_77085/m.240231 type:complete len:481 (+) Transcript_77085:194-1636(+)
MRMPSMVVLAAGFTSERASKASTGVAAAAGAGACRGAGDGCGGVCVGGDRCRGVRRTERDGLAGGRLGRWHTSSHVGVASVLLTPPSMATESVDGDESRSPTTLSTELPASTSEAPQIVTVRADGVDWSSSSDGGLSMLQRPLGDSGSHSKNRRGFSTQATSSSPAPSLITSWHRWAAIAAMPADRNIRVPGRPSVDSRPLPSGMKPGGVTPNIELSMDTGSDRLLRLVWVVLLLSGPDILMELLRCVANSGCLAACTRMPKEDRTRATCPTVCSLLPRRLPRVNSPKSACVDEGSASSPGSGSSSVLTACSAASASFMAACPRGVCLDASPLGDILATKRLTSSSCMAHVSETLLLLTMSWVSLFFMSLSVPNIVSMSARVCRAMGDGEASATFLAFCVSLRRYSNRRRTLATTATFRFTYSLRSLARRFCSAFSRSWRSLLSCSTSWNTSVTRRTFTFSLALDCTAFRLLWKRMDVAV